MNNLAMAKNIITTSLILAITIGLLPATYASPHNNLASIVTETTTPNRLNRGDHLRQLAEIEAKHHQNPQNRTTKLSYAKKLFEVGYLEKAQEILESIVNENNPPVEAIYLLAKVDYLNGHYIQAENLYNYLVNNHSGAINAKAQIGLLYTYYQTNQYNLAQNLFKNIQKNTHLKKMVLQSPDQGDLSLWNMMKSFGNQEPYQVTWQKEHKTVLPFIAMNNLPVVSLEINGKPINVIIDTGGEIFVLEKSIADKLGIKPVANSIGIYAGGKTADVSYGKADQLKLNGVTLKSVPVTISSLPPELTFYDETKAKDIPIDGILTTGILQQFLATIDYPNKQLVLRPRNEMGKKMLQAELSKEKLISHLPFVLDSTHLIISQGAINGKKDMRFFLDSGLDDPEAGILLHKETLEYVGIPIPVSLENKQGGVGLGGGDFGVATFNINKIELGKLKQQNLKGYYGVLPPEIYYAPSEFILDGFISHQFLKHYKWTIDFDAMNMTFTQ